MTDEQMVGTLGNPIDLKNRKIGIGVPSGDMIPIDLLNCFIQLITQTSQYVSLGLTNSISSNIAVNRNSIVKNARELGATDILWIDSDSIFPIHGLMKLLMHDKDIVCATTSRRKGNSRDPIGVVMDINSITPHQKLVQFRSIGFPFMLTKMSVFDRLDEMGLAPDGTYFANPARWMMPELGLDIEKGDAIVAEDEYWCYLVRKAGFEIWCDMELSMEIGHIGMYPFYIQQQPLEDAKTKVDEVLA